jgi:pimeloyl-ACP methyl ester carboxylesterase
MAEQSRLYFTDEGEGNVLVCLHGFLESSRMWNKLELPTPLRRIAPDFPGHGESALQSYANMEELADMVLDLLDHLKIQSYVLMGHSMGGYVALEMAQKDPRCARLIMLNSNPWSDDPQKQLDRQRVAEIVMHSKKHFIYEAIPHLFWRPEDHAADVEMLIHEAAHIQPEAIAMASMAMSRRRDLSDFAKESGQRIRFIQGEFDAVVPLERVRKLQLDTACDFVLIPDSGHMSLFEQPDLVRQALNEVAK